MGHNLLHTFPLDHCMEDGGQNWIESRYLHNLAVTIRETWQQLHQLLTVKQDLVPLSICGQSCGGA